ncbi:mediator of rna polymerase ii transcription subunit 19a, partial [Fagus crenata]
FSTFPPIPELGDSPASQIQNLSFPLTNLHRSNSIPAFNFHPVVSFSVMDLEGRKFGRGPRELGGSVDLINQYKLWPHHEFFCKRSLPLSVSQTHYLRNVVGDTEIRKGDGMELDQLSHNISSLRERNAHIHPFDLDVLWEAFQMRETTPVCLTAAEKGMPSAGMRLNSDSRDQERKHKKHKDKKKKDKDHKKHKHHNKDKSGDKDKNRDGHHDLKQQDKKRRHEGNGDFSDIRKHQKNSKINATVN